MDTLKAKIEKATAPRMKENYDGEMEETTSGTIRVTPKELNTLVRMRKVKVVMVASGIRAFEGETNSYFAPHNSIQVSKKIVKKLVSDFTRSAETYENRDDVDEEIMAEVYVSTWRDDQLYISIN
jgi:hypothetical protein|tara:strand:+ start:1334 stop:1708 length:375 start_codon:yes stop_codon:yes gene_type:complete